PNDACNNGTQIDLLTCNTIFSFVYLLSRCNPAVLLCIPYLAFFKFTVDVESDDEFVSTLHLTVHPLDRPDHIVAKHDFADSELFLLPPSKMNSVVGRDMVVRLTTSLDPAIYTNIAVQQVVLKPTIDNSVHHTFVFRPKLRPSSSNWPRSEL
ncbi:hypothetical protein AHF37_10087, partial [Paragonimus kellicotti]